MAKYIHNGEKYKLVDQGPKSKTHCEFCDLKDKDGRCLCLGLNDISCYENGNLNRIFKKSDE